MGCEGLGFTEFTTLVTYGAKTPIEENIVGDQCCWAVIGIEL